MVGDWSEPLSVDQMHGDWDYEAAVAMLARSLGPRSRTSLYDTLGSVGLGTGDVVLDIGGRDARHSLAIAERLGCRVVAVDPVEANSNALRSIYRMIGKLEARVYVLRRAATAETRRAAAAP